MERRRAEKYAGQQRPGNFLFNSRTGQILGRTCCSWLMITVFYIIFYTFLSCFFSLMMFCFLCTIDPVSMPKYIPGNGDSLLRNPALSLRPTEGIYSTTIWFEKGMKSYSQHLRYQLDDFIRPYEGSSYHIYGQHLVRCHEDRMPHPGEVCIFQDVWLNGRCNREEGWGYAQGSPCILLKLNKMIGWFPEVYQYLDELPYSMPSSLKEHISRRTLENDNVMPRMVWVSCEGDPSSQENIGPVQYSPWQGFPSYYFPYTNAPGYLSPLVAVQFDSLPTNASVKVECRAWARNIVHDRQNNLGVTKFEFRMMD